MEKRNIAKEMADVILLYPKTGVDIKHYSVHLPLSILCLAATLRQENYKVKIIDQRIDTEWKYNLEKALISKPFLVGISAMTGPQIKYGLEMASTVRNLSPQIPLVWGGVHPTILPEQTLRHPLVDIIVQGEGEKTILELTESLRDKKALTEVNGIYYKVDGRIFSTPSRELVNFDNLPDIPYDLVKVDDYLCHQVYSHSLVLIHYFSKGCPYRCGFCFIGPYYKFKWRSKSPVKFVKELERIKNYKKEIKGVFLTDDNFFVSKEKIEEIYSLLKRKSLGLEIFSCCRVDYILDAEIDLLKSLRDAGFTVFFIGVESGTDRVLRYINKGITVEGVIEANKKLKKVDIVPNYSFMAGFPGETMNEIKQTLKLMERLSKENKHAIIQPLRMYTPYPGTELIQSCPEDILPRCFEEWSDAFYYNNVITGFDPKINQFYKKALIFSTFIDGHNPLLTDLTKKSKLFKLIIKFYRYIVKLRLKNNFYSFAPEIYAIKVIERILLKLYR